MAEVVYRGPGPEARINNRLKPSSPEGYTNTVTTQPTRTVTCVYPSGFQAQHGDEPKGSNGEQSNGY